MTMPTVLIRNLPPGADGTRETLRAMAHLARSFAHNARIYTLSRELVKSVPEKDYPGQARVLYEFVRDKIRYVPDIEGTETLQWPTVTLDIGQGDCDDKVTLLCALLKSCGHPSRICAVKVDDDKNYSHVFAQTRIGPHWITLETTEGRLPMGDGGPNFHRIKQPMMIYHV